MKIFITAVSAFLMSLPTWAATNNSWSLDMRADYLSNDYSDESSTAADNTSFQLQNLRIDGKGQLNDSVSYRVRFKFTTNRTVSTRDKLGTDVDLANIMNKFNDNFSFTLGKFASDIGGHEGMTPSPELYLNTINYSSTTLGTSNLRYYTGAKLTSKWMDQELALHVANLDADSTGTANNGTGTGVFNQNKSMMGVVYKGQFMDKTLIPVASYHWQEAKAGSGTAGDNSKYKNSYTTVGLKYDVEMFTVEADYMMNKLGSYTTIDRDDKLTTLQAGFAYKMGLWTPRLKYESSDERVQTSATVETKNTYTGYQLAVEYKPSTEDMFRYHAAYWSRDKKSDNGTTSTTTTDKQIILGARILADFLK